MTWQMIDVSSNNHPDNDPILWHDVAAHGVRGVMIKATEGVDYVNPWLNRDAHGARAAGLHVGYYHFARPISDEGTAEAEFCLKAIEGLPRDLGVALDLEVMNNLDWVDLDIYGRGFLGYIAEHVVLPSLYTAPSFLDHMPAAPWGHKLWLADWERQPRRQCWIWQHGIGSVPGVPGPVDLDTYFG